MINYGLDGLQSVNFHYRTRLLSNSFNKLLYNIFETGVIPESGEITVFNADEEQVAAATSQGLQIKIPAGFSLLISPNNRYAGGTIQQNFEAPALSSIEQNIIERQILKCDVIKDFYVYPKIITGITNATTEIITSENHGFTNGSVVFIKGGEQAGLIFGTPYYVHNATYKTFQISTTYKPAGGDTIIDITAGMTVSIIQTFSGYLVAEYNYLEFSNLEVEFKMVPHGEQGARVILGYVNTSGNFISAVDVSTQDVCKLNDAILYEMNTDRLDGYHAGNESGYIPLSNGTMCSGLNTNLVGGYWGYQAAQKWKLNWKFNVEYIGDEFGTYHQPGNAFNNIPLSAGSGTTNVGLNTEFISGSGYTAFENTVHVHYLDDITDGDIYKRPLGVNTNHRVTYESFKAGAITKNKIASECFFARNNDLGGEPIIITGEILLTISGQRVDFNPKNSTAQLFAYPPDVMLQIVDDGSGNYDDYHIKLKATNITETHFTAEYEIYKSTVDTVGYSGIAVEDLTIQFVALGYGDFVDNFV